MAKRISNMNQLAKASVYIDYDSMDKYVNATGF